jgi:hypothetical protein
MEGLRVSHEGSYVRSLPNWRWPQTLGSPPEGALPALGQVLSNWKGVVTSPMTPEELSALAAKIAGFTASKARLYFLVPKRQQLPPVTEELEPGSVRLGCSSCLSAWWPPG